MVTILEKIIALVPRIDTHLQYYAFIVSVALIAASIFLRSYKFHSVWSKTMQMKLDSSSIFRLFRMLILFIGVITLSIAILAFISPVIMEKIQMEKKKSVLDFLARDKVTIISELESPEFRDKFREAWILFKHSKNYDAAREEFLKLEKISVDELTRENLAGLVTATFYVQKRHEDGLDFICDRYRSLQKTDSRYRYEIHAHIRKIALDSGFERAEKLILQYANRCKRSDFSPVWIAIPRAKIEYLVSHHTNKEERYVLEKKEKGYLTRLIRENKVGFLDHSHYFLYQYTTLINKYKDSLILDMAILGQAQSSNEGRESAHYYDLFLKKFPRSPRADDAIDGLFRNLVWAGDFDAAMAVLERVVNYEVWNFEYEWQKYLDHGESHYLRGDYQQALKVYEAQKKRMQSVGAPVPERLSAKIEELRIIIPMSKDQTVSGLWKLAIYFRDVAGKYYTRVGRHQNAIRLFDQIKDLHPSSIDAQRALFLKASSLRKLGKYRESFDTLTAFTSLYQGSYLADDAYAELGWYKMYIEENYVEAKEYFQRCVINYPTSNAIDNCLYHLANGSITKGDYKTALSTYSQLARDFAHTRLGVGANSVNNLEVAQIAELGKKREPPGAIFEDAWRGIVVAEVADGSWASRIGLKKDDKIVQINGAKVHTILEFHYELGKVDKDVEIRIVRDDDTYQLKYNGKQ